MPNKATAYLLNSLVKICKFVFIDLILHLTLNKTILRLKEILNIISIMFELFCHFCLSCIFSLHAGMSVAPPPNSRGVRIPPSYNVAAQMARLHRLGRAHSHEGVTSTSSLPTGTYFHSPTHGDDDGK